MTSSLPNVRHLIAFCEVSEQKRIGLASARVHLSQPAITQAIAKLEKSFDAPLFDRRPQGMFLTEVGDVLYSRTKRLISHLQTGAQLALKRAPRATGKRARREFYKHATQVQLQSLIAIAHAGSYSQAARDIGAKQPAVHRAARELQNLAEIQFFEPVRRGVDLTPAGEALVHHVRLAVGEWRQAGYEVGACLGRDSTRIAVGTLPLSRTALLPAAIDQLLETSGTGLQVQCIDAPYPTLLRDLRFGDIDFIVGALRARIASDDIAQEHLFSDRLSIVTHPDHPLARHPNPSLEDTLAYPWIAPPKQTPSGAYLFDTLKIQDLPETPVRIVSSSLILVRGLMLRGNYVTIMSENQFEIERQQGLLTSLDIPLKESVRSIGLTYRKDWQPTKTQAAFLDLIRAQCKADP